jgi:hypothetical protein
VTGVTPSGSGLRPCGAEPAAQSQAEPLVPNAAELAALHERYGPCDGFGPLWTCSACTGILGGEVGYRTIFAGEVSDEEAANILGDFLLEKAERAALEAMGCCDSPAAVADYMRRALLLDFPGQPWRHGDDLFHQALAAAGLDKFGSPAASGMEAATAGATSTQIEGSTEGDSPVPKADAKGSGHE